MHRKYWKGTYLKQLLPNQVFVFGSNPEGRHGKGAAKAALSFGAVLGQGRGLMGQTYGLVTKNLKAGFIEKSTGYRYPKAGLKSVSPAQVIENILQLYELASKMPQLEFLISYQHSIDLKGVPAVSLNGYSCSEMLSFFMQNSIPDNIIFHESYAKFVEPSDSPALALKPSNLSLF